ncbi:hypothetical protein I0C86_33965 [Plantactinospora sp. S1510]|uniref:Integral membrane protein n=1 Tax=Plantactinospora alkalitolerans TaxID=2789879 RepID=A0ABS0H609_9ACTN|nr:hypothetical protein [Plantactinospora alkalitolerans]MBF9133905.1 hypothetical protein [Plantactinospora alkalitolerans]
MPSLPSLPMSASPELNPDLPPAGRPAVLTALDVVLRVVGGLVAVAGAVVTAVLELMLATLRVGGVLVGVSALLAVLANVALGWFAPRAVGRRWAFALPAIVWFMLMVVAAGGTSEGDVLIANNNWVGLAMIFGGSVAFAVMGFRMIIAPRGAEPGLGRR